MRISFYKKLKSIIAVAVLGTFIFVNSADVKATNSTLQQAQNNLNTATKDLENANKNISKIEKQQQQLQNEIDALDEELYQVVAEVEGLEEELIVAEEEILMTQEALEEATASFDNQYAAMKLRIRYMYEQQSTSLLNTFMEAGNLNDALNKAEYITAVYSYDRDKLNQMNATKNEIAELAAALEEQKNDLEAQKANLVFAQAKLDSLISSKSKKLTNLDSELAKAKEVAKKAEAAKKAAQTAYNAAKANTSSNSSYNVNGTLNPAYSTGISPSSVVSFANQYVGGKYVWGGTSLTKGCDCSGFCIAVLKNFGITYKSRLTSAGFRSVGKEVSYNYVQPGDIVCYSGHVAMYAGNGRIVEAQSTKAGITNNRSINCHPIITIRRVL